MPDRRGGLASTALIAALILPCVAAPAEAGEQVGGEELRDLAERAATDPAARRELYQVRRVDGRTVDLRRALEGADQDSLRARFEALADGAGERRSAGASPEAARRDARRILAGRKFRPAPVPRPFHGVLRRMGEWLGPVLRPVGRLWDRLLDDVIGQTALALAVVGGAAVASLALARRRNSVGVRRAGREGYPGRHREEDPDELEQRADAAERAGQLELAFRLRFRAGLLRLDRAGALAYRPSLTTGELTRQLRSPTFDDLAGAFDEIAYGGRPAEEADLHAARRQWPMVLAQVGRR